MSYHDPEPLEFSDGLDQLHMNGIVVHKLILMADDDMLKLLRPSLQEHVEGIASLTFSVPGMLEVLPFMASKGDGVSKLIEHIGASPANTICFGTVI